MNGAIDLIAPNVNEGQMNHLIIDTDKCIGCGKCARMCLENNIVIEDRKAKEVGTKCLECSHCVSTCPKGAIRLAPKEEGEGGLFSSIKQDKMFDGGMVNDEDLKDLCTYMAHGSRDYDFFVLAGDDLDEFLDVVIDIIRQKEGDTPLVKDWSEFRDKHNSIKMNPILGEGDQVLFIFADSKEKALEASSRMVVRGLDLGIRGYHSNIIMAASRLDRNRVLEFFPETARELEMAFVIGHARRLIEPVFKPMKKVKSLLSKL